VDLPPAEWDRLIEGFDVEGLARQLQSVGAGYLGARWSGGEPRFPHAQVAEISAVIVQHGGVVTWDVPIPQGLRSGHFKCVRDFILF